MAGHAVEIIRDAANARGRLGLWQRVLSSVGARTVCEVGVYKGRFAERMLRSCPDIQQYYMIDPWRELSHWKKPSNRNDMDFDAIFDEAMAQTEPYASKRIVMRDVTTVASGQLADGSLDAAYIDGDHTLRGITIDLIKMLPKVRQGGILAGDDFTKNVWQHGARFSPTEVFPFAVYFAEAMGLPIVALPFNQFAIVNEPESGFELVDLAGYAELDPKDIYVMPRSPGRRGAKKRQSSMKNGKSD